MKIHIGRIIVTAIAIEVLSIVSLVAVVALTGPGERIAAEAYAQKLGLWLGPLAGFVFCFFGGYWVAKRARYRPVAHGLAVGLATAIIDVVLLVASAPAFSPVFLLSNVGRVVAGALGGWVGTNRVHG